MTNIQNNGDASDQNPAEINPDETLDPVAPKEPKLHQSELGMPTMTNDPESSVGTGLNPP